MTDIPEIRSRVGAADEWDAKPTFTEGNKFYCGSYQLRRGETAVLVIDEYGDNDRANLEFIAHAREDIPYLLSELDKRDAEIAELRGELRAVYRVLGQQAESWQAMLREKAKEVDE